MPIFRYPAILFTILTLLIFLFAIKTRTFDTLPVIAPSSSSDFTVVIDAGHGGFDGGKVSSDGTLEKDVNLDIALKLKELLTAADIRVIMTRTTDTALGESSSSTKQQDMISRINLINDTAPDCVISIHQNSYPDESVDGAQVFYFTGSPQGKLLAETLQDHLVASADPSNHRTAKANDSYFLLKHSSVPIVIAECGFLSNPQECKKLVDDAYQQKLVWAIHLGVLQYLNTKNQSV